MLDDASLQSAKSDEVHNFEECKLETTKKEFLDKSKLYWRHFFAAVTGDIFFEFQRLIEITLALHDPIKPYCVRKGKPNFLLERKTDPNFVPTNWLLQLNKRKRGAFLIFQRLLIL